MFIGVEIYQTCLKLQKEKDLKKFNNYWDLKLSKKLKLIYG